MDLADEYEKWFKSKMHMMQNSTTFVHSPVHSGFTKIVEYTESGIKEIGLKYFLEMRGDEFAIHELEVAILAFKHDGHKRHLSDYVNTRRSDLLKLWIENER